MGAESTTDHFSSEQDDELPALQSKPNILNNPDLMILPNDSDGHVNALPAHIAARFHRPSLNRRRSSAASSRRNSFTSSQSHHSSRSYRNACQSNHVAQYLRRASIIEGRKARLAAKEAHAEQVRLRAALAKATPRVSNSEERALAAQQAREKYLAKVAAACAEEVNRAKKVAEENRERRAAEERRCRLEIEEKHAEAERRRLEYRRTSRKTRSTSFANVEGKKVAGGARNEVDLETAVKRIKHAWKGYQKKKKFGRFLALDLSVERVRELPFEEAAPVLADGKVLAATGEMLNLLGLEDSSKDNAISIRTFLSAYMILGHPADIFSKTGQQEQDLIDKAKELLISFEAVLSRSGSLLDLRIPPTDLATLSQAYSTYSTAFAAWKSQDASVLIETMVDQFVALDGIWQTVKDDTRGEVAHDYREGIRDQQVLLLSKIKRLAGPERSNILIKKAIRESRRAKTRTRPASDLRPRPAGPINPAAGPSTDPDTINPAAAVSQIAQDEVSARPEDYELTELSKVFSIVPPNRVLVHELVMDPSFKIEVAPQSDIRSALNRQVCESMRTGVLNGQGDVWTIAVAENIRKRLLKLLKPGNSMRKLISEVLDPEHVQNQCRQNLFSYEKFFQFMAGLLPRLCAPFRDAEVKTLADSLSSPGAELDVMVEKLFGLLHIIDLMSLDYTNYMLQQAAPTLIAESQGYEQRLFAQDLEEGTITLQRTKRWWRNASVNIVTEDTHNGTYSAAPPTFTRIYARGLVDLSVAMGPLQPGDLPETLQLDFDRLNRHRNKLLRYITVGAILLTAKNLLKRDVRTHWKAEARRIHDLLTQARLDTTSINNSLDAPSSVYANHSGNLAARILAIIETAHPMPQSSRDTLSTMTTRFLLSAHTASTSTASPYDPADPVLKLLLARLRAHVFARLAASSAAERVRVASTASEALAMIGLAEVVGEVSRLAEELLALMRCDLAAHGAWYGVVAGEVEDGGVAAADGGVEA